MYVEDLKRGTNKDIGPKDIFEMDSCYLLKMGTMADKKNTIQLIWGILLLIAGIGVFFRIPQVMPEIKKIEHFAPYMLFIYFCFYLLGILLIVGGGKKVYHYIKESKLDNPDN